MGFFKKIFKPVSRVLDKIIPNEIKPALPFAAAFAPFIAPGIMGTTVMQRALMGGGLNILGQLSQEGNEGDINLLSAGLGALSGAMSAPGTKGAPIGDGAQFVDTGAEAFKYSAAGQPSGAEFFQGISDSAQGTGVLASGQRFLGDTLVKGSNIMGEGIKQGLFTKAGAKAALLPAATATGDLMAAEAKRAQDEADRLAEEEAAAAGEDDAVRAFAIRRAMEAQGATEEEILDAIAAAGYKAGGRVGFETGGGLGAIARGMQGRKSESSDLDLMTIKATLNQVHTNNDDGEGGGMAAVMEFMEKNPEYKVQVMENIIGDRGNKIMVAPIEESPVNILDQDGIKTIMVPVGGELIMPENRAKGGRVGFSEGGSDFGGITEAVEKILKEPKTFLVDKLKVTMKPGQSEMRAIIEAMYNDVDGVMPDDRKKEFYELYAPQMYRNGEMEKSEFEFIQTEILGKEVPKMKEGGLMDLGGKEMDLRKGGFVPIGKKEKADDVPARLSKNEFVMTADAVRAAGGGSVNEGAKRMYKVMNDLEARA